MTSPKKPSIELKPITSNVVPTAILKGKRAKNMSDGRIRKPPPAPTKPPSIPVVKLTGSNIFSLSLP
jgi:hypothetical protein